MASRYIDLSVTDHRGGELDSISRHIAAVGVAVIQFIGQIRGIVSAQRRSGGTTLARILEWYPGVDHPQDPVGGPVGRDERRCASRVFLHAGSSDVSGCQLPAR